MIYKNPAVEIAKAPVKRKRLALPSAEQFQAIAKAIAGAGSKWPEDCADLVRLLAYSGARLGEATALRWSHVDAVKNQIIVPGTKTDTSHRIVPLFPALRALIAEIRARRPEDASTAAIVRVGGCRGALESAGVARMNHHDLRHLFAARCIESGVDIPTVSRWLGHSDDGTLAMKTYGHLRQEHSQAQATKVSFGVIEAVRHKGERPVVGVGLRGQITNHHCMKLSKPPPTPAELAAFVRAKDSTTPAVADDAVVAAAIRAWREWQPMVGCLMSPGHSRPFALRLSI